MRKLRVFLALLLAALSNPRWAAADSLTDQLYAGFVGRAKFAIESTSAGKSQGEFLVNYVEIGKAKGGYVGAIDAGVLGTVLPDSGQVKAADLTTGAKLHLASLLKSYVSLPPEWEFLGNLEIDGRASYNWRQRHPFYGIVAAYPWR